MSESTTAARCCQLDYNAARDAGLLVVTTADEEAVSKFAASIRERATAQPPGTFTHTPRPARRLTHLDQMGYYGPDFDAASNGTLAKNAAGPLVQVFRLDGVPLGSVTTHFRDSTRAHWVTLNLQLPAAELYELARRLIDAAADIEAEQKGGAA